MRRRARVALTLVATGTFLVSAWLTVTRDNAVLARVRDLLAQQVATPCTVEAAEFSFLDGLLLRGVTVHDPGDPLGPPLIHVAEARLEYVLDLLGEGPRITRIALRRPSLRIVADADGRFPMLEVLRATGKEGTPQATPRLPLLMVDGGRVTFSHPSVLAEERTLDVGSVVLQAGSVDGWGLQVLAHGNIGGLGDVRVQVRAERWSQRGEAEIQLTDAVVDDEIVALLPSHVVAWLEPAAPRARVAGRLSLETLGREITRFDATLDVTEGSARASLQDAPDQPPPLPIQLSGVTGHVEIRGGEILLSDVSGTVLDSPFRLEGVLPADIPGSRGDGADEVRVSVTIDDLAIGPAIGAHLPEHLRVIQSSYALAGRASVALDVRGRAPYPLIDAVVTVHEMQASYEGSPATERGGRSGFPWRVDGLTGQIDVVGPRVTIDAAGRHGAAPVTVEGVVDVTPGGLPITDVWIRAKEVPLDADLRGGFRERADAVWNRWEPSGVAAAVEVHVAQGGELPPRATSTDVRIHLDGRAQFVPDLLPVKLSGATGSVEIFEAPGVSRIWIDDVTVQAESFDVRVDGRVIALPASYAEELRLHVATAAAERGLVTALLRSPRIVEGTKRALRLLQPTGAIEADATIRSGGGPGRADVTVELAGGSVAGWEGIPLAAADLRGRVRITEDAVVTERLTGTVLSGAPFELSGRLDGLTGDRLRARVAVQARHLPLGERLRTALGSLAEPAAAFWDELAPGPDARADVEVLIRPDDDPAGTIDADLTALRGGIRVLGFDIQVDQGTLRHRRDASGGTATGTVGGAAVEITAAHVDAATGITDVSLAARGLAFPHDLAPLLSGDAIEALSAAVPGRVLHVPQLDLRYDPAERVVTLSGIVSLRPRDRAMPTDGLDPEGELLLRKGVIWLPPDDPVTFRLDGTLDDVRLRAGTDIEVQAGEVTASGGFPAEGATLDARVTRGRLIAFDLPVEDASFALFVRGRHVRVEEFAGELHGGRLTGRVGYGSKKLAYGGQFELHDTDLATFVGSGADGAVRGRLHAGVRFRNPGGEPEELEGTGRADVRDGRIASVPLLTPVMNGINAALLGVAGLEGEFHTGEMLFDLRGRRVLIRDVFLDGPNLLGLGPVELRDGQGAVSLDDGRIDAVIYPRIRVDPLGLDVLGIVDRILSAFQVLLGRFRIEGTLRSPRVTSEISGADPDGEFHPRPQPSGVTLPYGDEPW